MTVRQWLGRARRIDKELKDLEEQRKSVLESATRITQNYSGDGAQRTPDPHKFDRIAEFINLLDEKHDELIDAKREITEAIYRLHDGRYRQVLFGYYINGLWLEQIATEMHYSYKQIRRFRKLAEDKIAAMIDTTNGDAG